MIVPPCSRPSTLRQENMEAMAGYRTCFDLPQLDQAYYAQCCGKNGSYPSEDSVALTGLACPLIVSTVVSGICPVADSSVTDAILLPSALVAQALQTCSAIRFPRETNDSVVSGAGSSDDDRKEGDWTTVDVEEAYYLADSRYNCSALPVCIVSRVGLSCTIVLFPQSNVVSLRRRRQRAQGRASP